MQNNEKVEKVEELVKDIMRVLEIKETVSNRDTPRRVAKMYVNEFFENLHGSLEYDLTPNIKVFPVQDRNHNLIKMENIKFNSICEHHWLPFSGYVNIEYKPNNYVIGLSKLPRIVRYFSKMPQLQETLTEDICSYIVHILDPLYVKVTVVATHSCVSCRGIESDCITTTESDYSVGY